ncbi:hypothetical protein KUCAC02_025352 [Chaenocephalus aceratus]|uniref:Uncharacterized protein n=1 Tax=Chaenocephalus aceratus TaxID=36190 RepID=A0ACB9VV22_CHAAC|nr:hypothetical protein KUCAC02_025352 [Chaenocephalus aceratus]
MAANTRDNSVAAPNTNLDKDLEDLSDNDDPILDANYQPPPQEQSSSEDEDDSSDDEDPIPQPTEHSRGRKRLRGANNGSGTGTDTGSSRTPRRRRQTQQIEADRSDDDSEEPTPGPSTQGQPNKGCGLRWRATPLTPDLAQFEHEDETELDRNGWTPLNYFEQSKKKRWAWGWEA